MQIHIDQSFCCPICFTQETNPENISECGHAFCKACLQEHIDTQIKNMNVLKIKCPQDGCSNLIKEKTIKTILDEQSFKRYQYLVQQKLTKKKPTNICPKPGCSKQILFQKDSQFIQCACDTMICNSCGDFWHEGKNCLEVIDPEFEKYVQENHLRFCTMCKTIVARVEGCTHITCPVCDYEWCWLCGREHSESHDWRCPKIWSPIPPKTILREDSTRPACIIQTLSFLRKLLIFLILLPLRLLFWPLWMLNVLAEMRSPNREKSEKIQILLVAIIATLIHIGLVFMMLWFTFAGYGVVASLILGLTCGLMLLIPWVFKIFVEVRDFLNERNSAHEGPTKRWLTRDSDNFKYTNSHRPTLDNNNGSDIYVHFQRPRIDHGQAITIPTNKVAPIVSRDIEV